MKFSHVYDSQKKLKDVMTKQFDVFESLIEMVKEREQDREFGYIFGITYNYYREFLYSYYGLIECLDDINSFPVNVQSIDSFYDDFIKSFKYIVEGFFVYFVVHTKISSLNIIDYISEMGVDNLTFIDNLSQEEINFIKDIINIYLELK